MSLGLMTGDDMVEFLYAQGAQEREMRQAERDKHLRREREATRERSFREIDEEFDQED